VYILSEARSLSGGMPKKDQRQPTLPRSPGQCILAKDQHDGNWKWSPSAISPGPGFSVLSLMEPLRQAPAIIPHIIMSLCAVSIVTYNKLSEVVMPFYGGNKMRPQINVTTGTKIFNWLFDMGPAITYMNTNSFRDAFGHSWPKLIKKSAGCVGANGSKMSYWAFLK